MNSPFQGMYDTSNSPLSIDPEDGVSTLYFNNV